MQQNQSSGQAVTRYSNWSKIFISACFLANAAVVGDALLRQDSLGWSRPMPLAEIASLAGVVGFAAAFFITFTRPRLGYSLGLVAGLIALPWFLLTELLSYPWANSWIYLNIPETGFPRGMQERFLAEIRIASVALLVIAIICSAMRLLPARWVFRKTPIKNRTWPAFAVCLAVLSGWFLISVRPYRLPGFIDHDISSDIRILHIQKRGLNFHELSIATYRDRTFRVTQTDRHLFQYQFTRSSHSGIMPPETSEINKTVAYSSTLSSIRTPQAKALRQWNAEGWYVRLRNGRVLAFTSEDGTTPPTDVFDLFEALEEVPAPEETTWKERDVCLGFCYDPLAAMGFEFSNDRCSTTLDGKATCH